MIKKRYLIIFMALLIVGMSVAVAADTNNTDVSVQKDTIQTSNIEKTATTTATTIKTNETKKKMNNIIIKKDNNNNNLKTASTYYINNDEDYDNLFTKINKVYYLKNSVTSGSNITFNTDISRTGSSYVINKAVNIWGNDHTYTLNTGVNFSKHSLNFVNSASNSNISDFKFLNTQIYVNTSSNITFDNITFEVTNKGVGAGVGAFAIRDGSINITVKNSDFITNNNGGYSTLVLTWAKNCTIDQNNITGIGSVGNLVYLNNYGAGSNANNITNNSGNVISNNNITGPNPGSWLCYSVAISGPNNTVENNTIINYGSYAVTTIWNGSYDNTTDPEDTHNVSYFGNKYINNNITGGFSTGNYSIVQNNNITGTSNIVGHANVTGNNFYNQVTLQNDVDFQNNNVTNNNVYVKLPNCHIKDSTIKLLNVSVEANPTYNCSGNNFIDGINDTNGNLVNCTGNYSWTQSNTNILLMKKYSANTKEYNEDYDPYDDSSYWVETIDEEKQIYVIHITEENISPVFNGEYYVSAVWLRNSEVPINFTYYLDCDLPSGMDYNYDFDFYAYPGNTTYCLNGKTLHEALLTSRKTSNKIVPAENLIVQDFNVIVDNDYFIDGTDENGWYYVARGNTPVFGPMPTLLRNVSITVNITEDNMHSQIESLNFISSTLFNRTTFENCTFNIGLPVQKLRMIDDGSYSSKLVPITLFGSLNVTVTNSTFNIFCLSDEEDINGEDTYPCFMNMTSTDHTINFTGNTINLNNVKGFILNTNNAIIENNIITTNYDHAIELTGNENIVRNNYLVAKELKGNNAILATGEGNIIENNTPGPETEFKVISPVTANINETTPITIILKDENGNLVPNEEISIAINDNETETKTTDEYGMVIYELTPTTSGELTLTIKHEKTTYGASNTTVTINVNEDKDAIIEELNNTIKEQEETINTLNDTVNNQTEAITKLNDTVNEQAKTIEEQAQAINELNNTINNQTQTITEQEGTISELNDTVNEQAQTITEQEEAIAELNNTINNQTQTIDEQAQAINELNNTVNEQAQTITEQEEAINELNDTVNNQTAAIEALENSVEELKDIIENLTAIKPSTITLDAVEDAQVGDTITITGTLSDENGYGIPGTVKLLINNGRATVKTNVNGEFTYDYTVTKVGTYNVTASYTGTDSYTASNTTMNFDVAQQDTIIVIDEITPVKSGSNVTVTGTLLDANGNPIKGTIKLLINNGRATVKTDDNGVFTYNFVASKVGINNITASYLESTKYLASNATATVEVTAMDTQIVFDEISSVKKGEKITITGKLLDENGNAVTGTIKLLINNGRATVKTDENGVFTYEYTVSKVGVNNITASYLGANKYTATEATTTAQVEKLATVITLNNIGTVTQKSMVEISGKLADENGKAITGTIKLLINNGRKTVKTDSTGVFTYSHNATFAGENTITANYLESNNYLPTNTTTTFTVTKA